MSGRPFIENFHWHPERGTRFLVVELATGRLRGTYRGPAFFAFHHVNAYERDGGIVIDVCAYDDAEVVRALYLDRLLGPDPRLPDAELRRYVVPLEGGEVHGERLAGVGIDLPRIGYQRHNGRPYRFAYGVGGQNPGDFANRIVKADVDSRKWTVWAQPGTYPGEPVFVRVPGDEREDGGVLLSVVLDPAQGASFPLGLDAVELTELARAWVPHGIPLGSTATISRAE